jgi:hypothetical protein
VKARALAAEWLSQRGVAIEDLGDDDLRIDLVYLGRERGVCDVRVSVRTGALTA